MNNSDNIIAWIGRLLLLIAFFIFLSIINSSGSGDNENYFNTFFVSSFATVFGGYILYRITGVKKYIKTNSEKEFEDGMKLYKKEEYSEAIQVLLPLADRSYEKNNWVSTNISIIAGKIKKSWGGYAKAQFQLGEMYEYGKGVVQNYEKAFEWYEKGASQGHARSQANLGYLYRNGYGVKKDEKKALKLYIKAAKQGNVSGQNNLGHVYDFGFGVKINYKEALKWYGKAAEQAHSTTQNNIGYIHSKGLGIRKDEVKAVEWYRQSAKNGYSTGQYNLARVYEEGLGVEQSNFHAYKWFFIADKNGDEYAKGKLDELKTKMTKDEIGKAIELAEKCIESKCKDCGEPSEDNA